MIGVWYSGNDKRTQSWGSHPSSYLLQRHTCLSCWACQLPVQLQWQKKRGCSQCFPAMCMVTEANRVLLYMHPSDLKGQRYTWESWLSACATMSRIPWKMHPQPMWTHGNSASAWVSIWHLSRDWYTNCESHSGHWCGHCQVEWRCIWFPNVSLLPQCWPQIVHQNWCPWMLRRWVLYLCCVKKLLQGAAGVGPVPWTQ